MVEMAKAYDLNIYGYLKFLLEHRPSKDMTDEQLNSVDGANASAVVYTMVEMAKAYDLNIYGYLKFLLEHRPSKDMTDEQLAELAPWSKKLQSIKNRM